MLLQLLDRHWSEYRVEHSALPLTRFATLVEALLAVKSDGSLHKHIFTIDDAKVEAVLTRSMCIFNTKLKVAVLPPDDCHLQIAIIMVQLH